MNQDQQDQIDRLTGRKKRLLREFQHARSTIRRALLWFTENESDPKMLTPAAVEDLCELIDTTNCQLKASGLGYIAARDERAELTS